MNIRIIIAAAIACTALALAGCGTSAPAPHTAAATTVPATATAAQPAASPSPSPAAPATALTIGQAKAAYQRIVDPTNRANDAVNTDMTDAAPMAQFRADIAVLIARTRTFGAELKAIQWPASVKPYVTAMTLTDIPSNITCATAMGRATTYGDVQVALSTNQACTASQGSNNANQVRTLLGLPARS